MFFLTGAWLNKADSKVVQSFINPWRAIWGNALNIIRILGTGVALIAITWMAIQYFTADGRGAPFASERKALIKGTQLWNFTIGLVIFVGATNIIYILATFVKDIFVG